MVFIETSKKKDSPTLTYFKNIWAQREYSLEIHICSTKHLLRISVK